MAELGRLAGCVARGSSLQERVFLHRLVFLELRTVAASDQSGISATGH